MNFEKTLKVTGWFLVFALLAMNVVWLYQVKKNRVHGAPFKELNIDKPTLIVILDEFECATCVENIKILNNLANQENIVGRIDFYCLIVSKSKSDSKKIAPFFSFPTFVTDNYEIFRRLNINKTPLLLGLSPQKQIIYSEFLPPSIVVSERYLRKGIIDRLYYSEYEN